MKAFATSLAGCIATLMAIPIADAQPATYLNPVLRGDYPDPSVIRVGSDYYATATASEWGPQFPILHSKDLVNWEIVGSIFSKPPEWATANFWAPEICEWKGKYFTYYVGRKKGGPLAVAVATATDPRGPWTDHGPLVAQEAGSIDGVACDDENGHRWLVWKEDGNSRNKPTVLWAQRLDENGTRLIDQPHELLRNDAPWEGAVVEGPFILRRGDWFYLFYAGNACCGRGCKYAAGVARSKKFLGPYEKNPQNPILKTSERFRGPGHGSIVADPGGRLFFLYHAYVLPTFIYTGREMMLDEVTFGDDGWPIVGRDAVPSVSAAAPPNAAPQRRAELNFNDDFNSSPLRPGWQWPQDRQPDPRLEGGHLVLTGAPASAKPEPFSAVLARSCTSGDYAATTALDLDRLTGNTTAGLSAFGDMANALGVTVGAGKALLYRIQKGERKELARVACATTGTLQLRMNATAGHRFQFALSSNGREWTPIGSTEGDYLPPWDRSIRIALTAHGAAPATARFDFLRVEATDAGTEGESVGSKK